MAHFARVGRESLYAMQPPIQFNEVAAPMQGSMNVQPVWKHQYSSNMPKKNRKWKKQNIHADLAADTSHGPAGHSFNSQVHLAPSLPVAAPSTPAPSSASPPSPESASRPQQEVHSNQQDSQKSQKMTRLSAYIPPHLRKKQQELAEAPAENVAATKLTDVECARAELAQVKLEPVYGQPQAPPSPPSSPPENRQAPDCSLPTPVTDAEAQLNEAWGYEEPVPEPPKQPKKRRNGRWPSPVRRGRHIWPKNRDMKPVSDDEDDGGIGYKSDSNGDPDYDIKKLIDWNGDWLPPPETWSARHAFTDRHFGVSIEKWINGHDPSCTDSFTDLLVLPGFKGIKANGKDVTMEIAPRNWVPSSIEGDAPQSFWQSFQTRAPPPLSDIDMTGYRPFWEDYQLNSVFLSPIEHAEDPTLDMNDGENSKPGASQSAVQTMEVIAAKKRAREKRRQEKLNRPIAMPEFTPRPGYRPTSNVYFRPVVPADAKGIQELYNHYVEKTISVPEFEPRSGKAIVDRIRAIIDEGLPYIVAVQKGFRLVGPQDYVNESIVGFACMEDFCARDSMYRFTFELECYVHPDFLRQNIAKCLLDRLLEMVNTSYPAKGGYDWINRGEYLEHGCGRVVKVINCNVPHDAADDMVWMTSFLRKFNFRKAGHLKKMGYKFGKVVDVTVYQHETSENINPDVPPLRPL